MSGLSQRRRSGSEREVGGGYTTDEPAPSTALHGLTSASFDAVRWTVKLPSWCSSLTATLWRYSAVLACWTREADLGTFTRAFSVVQDLDGGRVWLQLRDVEGTADEEDPIRKSVQFLAREA